jgi:hypothetical protein
MGVSRWDSPTCPRMSGESVGRCLTFCRGAWMMEVGWGMVLSLSRHGMVGPDPGGAATIRWKGRFPLGDDPASSASGNPTHDLKEVS